MDATNRLTGGVRAAYGLGLAAEGIKNNAFNTFLLFFYQQIVGLGAALCGLALFLSLCADAVLDPAIGVWSDRVRSRLGRRHPFLYAACLPLSLCFLAVFMPPTHVSEGVKFAWLLVFAIGTRFSMALFVIPHQSLVPELTRDPDERTTLMSLRTVFAWIFGLLNALLAYTVFLRATPAHPQGLLNPEGYRPFAIFGAVMMFVAMLACALGTQKAALRTAPRTNALAHIRMRELPRALLAALASPSYRAAVIAGLFLFVGYGMTENLNNYMNTFFWGFTPQEIGGFIVLIFSASIVVLLAARMLVRRFGNRTVGLAAAAVITVTNPGLITLRLLGVLPEPGDPRLFRVVAGAVFLVYGAVIMGMTVVGTMIAHVTDEHELRIGVRQEGLLFAGAMFISKSASGLGTLVSGIVIKIAHFPDNATRATVDPHAIRNLGAGSAVAGVLFGLGMSYFFGRYTLDRREHSRILEEISKRRTEGGAHAATAM